MRFAVPVVVTLAMSWMAVPLPAEPPGEGWELVFHDEFNGKQLNWNVWTCEQGDRRNAYNDPEDSYLDGQGHLLLRVRKAPDGKYHLGFIRTQQEFQWGYYEARTNLDTVPGYWSAFWLWGKHSYDADYSGAEVDFLEDPRRDDTIDHNIHQGEGATHLHEGKVAKFKGSREDFHLWGCNWLANGFEFFVDGEQTWATRTMKASRPNWIYLTQEAEFKGWAGDIRQHENQLPAYWKVDYVRYYRKNPQAPSIAIAAPKPVAAGHENGKVILVTLSNGKFAAPVHPQSWSLEGLPSGVSLGSVKRKGDTLLEVKLKGNSRPGSTTADVTGITVIAESGEVAGSQSLLIATHGVSIQAKP